MSAIEDSRDLKHAREEIYQMRDHISDLQIENRQLKERLERKERLLAKSENVLEQTIRYLKKFNPGTDMNQVLKQ